MGYDEFDAECQRVLSAASEVGGPVLAAEIERLRGLAVSLADPGERRDAENDIAMLNDILAYDDQPADSPAMSQAERVHAAAMADGGTSAERIARAEAGMTAIARLAQANPGERTAIMGLNESLYLLILALPSDRS